MECGQLWTLENIFHKLTPKVYMSDLVVVNNFQQPVFPGCRQLHQIVPILVNVIDALLDLV